MTSTRVVLELDSLYENVKGEKEDFMDEDHFRTKVEELVDIGFIETCVYDDSVIYSAKHGLNWHDFVDIDDSTKKRILMLLVENPTTFFVLCNTQKGKMRINALEIKKWGEDKKYRVVSFIVVDNDTTLADQSAEGIHRTIGELNVNLMMLSTNAKTKYNDIKTTIDAYEFNPEEYKMPVIVLLANRTQIEKMVGILHYIDTKIRNRGSLLRYGIIWDEADKIYKQFRDTQFNIMDRWVSVKNYIVNDNVGLYRLGFTTATDGDLLDEDYPECANAYLYPVVIDPEDETHYRALHHEEATCHHVEFLSKTNNNAYAMKILEENFDHFNTPIILPSGETYYRKIIVNSNSKTGDMVDFARWCNSQNMYALIFNGANTTSVKLYIDGVCKKIYKTRSKKFNEILFYAYKKRCLNDKPLVIIGRKKVDRGLGFHYCPRTNDEITIDYGFDEGPLVAKNREGLIWTDMILGKIEDKNVAVQKAGRLAGIIGNSPQYCGRIHYWTDTHTEDLVRRHNTIVDKANSLHGAYSVLQAFSHATCMILPTNPTKRRIHDVDSDRFLVYTDESIVKIVCGKLGYKYMSTSTHSDGFKHTSLNAVKRKISLIEAIQAVLNGYGYGHSQSYVKLNADKRIGKIVGDPTPDGVYTINIVNSDTVEARGSEFKKIQYRTYYPCYKDLNDSTSLHYVIIIRPFDEEKLPEIIREHPPICVPKEEDNEPIVL